MKLRGRRDSNKDRSLRSEKQIAAALGGRRQPASGALPVAGFKGDVITKLFLIDDKLTEKDSHSLKLSVLLKLRKEAAQARRVPVLALTFHGGRGRYYVLSEMEFSEYVHMKEKEAADEQRKKVA